MNSSSLALRASTEMIISGVPNFVTVPYWPHQFEQGRRLQTRMQPSCTTAGASRGLIILLETLLTLVQLLGAGVVGVGG